MSTAVTKVDSEEVWDLNKVATYLDEKRRAIFLRQLSLTGNLLRSAQAAGFQSTAPINRAMLNDPKFAEEVAIATAAGGDAMESELIRRAMEGVEKGVYFKGERVDTETQYSDSLLDTAVKAAKPEKYAQRKDIKHTHEGTIGVAVIPMVSGSVEDWERQSIATHDAQKRLTDTGGEIIDTTATEVPAADAVKRG